MFDSEFIRNALIAAPVILFSLTVHEFFHAYLAFRFGDTTARDMGRLTLNPLAHLDLFGTLMLFASEFRFGWAKPVPVNPYNLRNPRTADLWISAAGPLSNLSLALIFGIIFRGIDSGAMPLPPLHKFFALGVVINVSLAFFNLIPLFPLDGSHILKSLLPERYEMNLLQFERYAPFILMIIVISGVLWPVLGPLISFFVFLFGGPFIRLS